MSDESDIRTGDQKCKSCTGILYYTAALREKGRKPVCFGVSGTLNKKLSDQSLVQLNEQQEVKDLRAYVCIGYSTWSGLMERTGRVPLCLTGIQYLFTDRKTPEKVMSKQQTVSSRNQTHNNQRPGSAAGAPNNTGMPAGTKKTDPNSSSSDDDEAEGASSLPQDVVGQAAGVMLSWDVDKLNRLPGLMKKRMYKNYCALDKNVRSYGTTIHKQLYNHGVKLYSGGQYVVASAKKYAAKLADKL
jgi:hypothetical protein